MNIIQILASCILVAAPTAVRTGPTTITVTGADYAGITPDSPSIQVDTGTRLSMSMGQAQTWADESTRVIVYSVDPQTDYTIRAFTVEPLATVAEQFDFELPVTRADRLAWILYNRLIWEQAMNAEEPDFYEMSVAMQTAQAMLEERTEPQSHD